VPGGHLTCLIQHTEELAKHLQTCLNAAQAKMLCPGSSDSTAVG
jgi:hypothetical protein